MDITGPYIGLRVYIDAFGCNNPLGSSAGKHKVVGFYYSCILKLKAASKRCTIQTICLVFQSDIDFFGLSFCLKEAMHELENLVQDGLMDETTNKRIQIRIIASLGDNLGQVSQ